MTFKELPLYIAIYKYQRRPNGGADLTRREELREMLARVVVYYLEDNPELVGGFPYEMDDVYRGYLNVRKSTTTRLKIETAMIHGQRCFWANRGLGDCSDQVVVDHLVCRVNGGADDPRNCMISCSYHNGSRGSRSVEMFLATGPDA